MAEFITLAAPVLMGVSAFGDLAGGFIQAEGFKAEAQQKEVQASQQRLQAKQQSNDIRRKFLQDMSSTNAFLAGAGAITSSGNARAAFEESARNASRDIENVMFGGEIKASQSESSAQQSRSQATGAIITGASRSASKVVGGVVGGGG